MSRGSLGEGGGKLGNVADRLCCRTAEEERLLTNDASAINPSSRYRAINSKSKPNRITKVYMYDYQSELDNGSACALTWAGEAA